MLVFGFLTFLKPSPVPTKGRGDGPGIPRFLKKRYGQIPYLCYKKRRKAEIDMTSVIINK